MTSVSGGSSFLGMWLYGAKYSVDVSGSRLGFTGTIVVLGTLRSMLYVYGVSLSTEHIQINIKLRKPLINELWFQSVVNAFWYTPVFLLNSTGFNGEWVFNAWSMWGQEAGFLWNSIQTFSIGFSHTYLCAQQKVYRNPKLDLKLALFTSCKTKELKQELGPV